MREFMFDFLYGVLTLTSLFLFVFWARMTVDRVRSLGMSRAARAYDRYFFLCLSLSVLGLGTTILYAARTYANVTGGLSAHLLGTSGVFMAVGMIIILTSLCLMVWLAHLESGQTRWLWGMGFVTVSWTLFCLYVVHF